MVKRGRMRAPADVHAHARAPEEGRKLLDLVTSRLNCEAVIMEDLVPSLAVHGGPGMLGLASHTL
jgi:hypothetical protein